MVLMGVYLIIDFKPFSSVQRCGKIANKLMCSALSDAWCRATVQVERDRESEGEPAGHGFGRRSRQSQWRASYVQEGGGGETLVKASCRRRRCHGMEDLALQWFYNSEKHLGRPKETLRTTEKVGALTDRQTDGRT